MAPENSDETQRGDLTARQVPEMVLSDGSAASMTPPTAPAPAHLTATERALRRFAVNGNVVITGGTGTLAQAAARALLEHGASGLALLDLYPDQASAAVGQLGADFPGAKVVTIGVDVTEAGSVEAAMGEAEAALGSVDVLCCFAGIVGCYPSLDTTAGQWGRVLDVNTTGTFLCAQAAARLMVARGRGGRMVFVSSISGKLVNFPQPQAAYNVSKAGVRHLAKCLAAEWAVHGIRVNAILPGYADTILNEGDGLANARAIWNSRNPTGRMMSIDEITGPLICLCSTVGGAYVNGAELVVDGKLCCTTALKDFADDVGKEAKRYFEISISKLR